MARYGLVFNVERCDGCYACFLACKDEFTDNSHLPTSESTCVGENLIKVSEVQYGTHDKVKVDYVHTLCQHCQNPACMAKFPEEISMRPDGIVIIDPVKAKGKKEIVGSCPYGAITWNEKLEIPQKCTMCAHMLDAGEKVTRCFECCPNQAIMFGDLDDPNSEIAKYVAEHADELEQLHPEYGTKPSVYYRHLPKPFICGEVVFGDTGACAKDVKVTCKCVECGTEYETTTDFLGDFEFRFLPTNKNFVVTATADGYKPFTAEVKTAASVNLGEVLLEK